MEKIAEDLEAGSQEQEEQCFVCLIDKDEVEHLIGISFNELDHENREDIFLCGDCISEAHVILEETKFRKRVREEIAKLQKEENDEK